MTDKEIKRWEKYFEASQIEYRYYPDGFLDEIGLEKEERFELSVFYLPVEKLVVETKATGNVVLMTEMLIKICKERGWRYCVPVSGESESFDAIFFSRKQIGNKKPVNRYFLKWQDEVDKETEKVVLVESDSLKEIADYYPDILEIINLTALGLLPFSVLGKHRYDEIDDAKLVSEILSGEMNENY
ncbi:MAG TPA: hypothetical protein PK466_00810 [Thermotogota bacterium]|nr:hypothetical protein [Thermotogota bacterium]HPJ87720.1 hypothetical protein [Thermotogota bacterium]HPR94840.1 hypothetical protein [Thermotogota bacterium]